MKKTHLNTTTSHTAVKRSLRSAALLLSASAIISFSSLSLAGSPCKGLQQDACNGEQSCSWINSYVTKKGKTINAYCRNKPKQKTGKTVPSKGTAAMPDKQG